MKCLDRRFFIGAALAAASPVRAAMPEDGKLTFRALRHGSDIGTHSVSFLPEGADLTVRIAVDLAVGIGPIKLYHYTLRATETWRRGVLMEAVSDGVDGGNKVWMRAARQNGRLVVQGDKTARYTAPEDSIVASHWNRAELDAPMINLQNGELLAFTVQPRGMDTVQAHGRAVAAAHFALSGPATLNLWYDQADVWTALRAVANDGSVIEYHQA